MDILIVDKIGDVGTFKDKIDKLQTSGYITAPERELIEAVTEAGSASAHRGFAPSRWVLENVMEILEAILYKLYIAGEQAAHVKKRVPPRLR